MEEKKGSGFFLPLVILVILAGAGYFVFGGNMMNGGKSVQPIAVAPQAPTPAPSQPAVADVQATGNVDDAASAILSEAVNDPTGSAAENSDATVATIDQDAITSYSTAYDDTSI